MATLLERAAAGALAMICLMTPRVAGAQATDGPASVEGESLPLVERIRYDADPSCPSYAEFWDAVVSRARTDNPVSDRNFRVKLWLDDGGEGAARARVSEIVEGSAETTRELSGATCSEVADAAALVTALMAGVLAESEADADNGTEKPAQPEPEPDEPPSPGNADPLADTGTKPHTPTKPGWQWGVGLGISANTAVAPGLAFGPRVLVDAGPGRPDFWTPSARLSFSYLLPQATDTPVGTAEFSAALARVEACPLYIAVVDPVSVRPCALVDAGVLIAAGTDTDDAQSHTKPWLAPGALARLSAQLSKSMALELHAETFVPLLPARYYFLPDVQVHRVQSRLAAGFGAAAVALF